MRPIPRPGFDTLCPTAIGSTLGISIILKGTSTLAAMVNVYRQRQPDRLAIRAISQRWTFVVALGLILVGLGCLVLLRGVGSVSATAVPAVVAPSRDGLSAELLDSTRSLRATQEQAIDQLQILQDQLASQKEETRKLSEQIAGLADKLEILQQAVVGGSSTTPHAASSTSAKLR